MTYNETDKLLTDDLDENFTSSDDYEDVPYDEETSEGRPENQYEGMNAFSSESFNFVGALEADTLKGVDPEKLLSSHGMMLKYSDERYEELFASLREHIEKYHEMDEDIFNDIFYGKISAITKNCYNSFKCSFACESVLDLFQEAYMLIYTKSIPGFFLREDDGEDRSKDHVAYLRWCKTCIMNKIKSKLRGKKKIDLVQLRFDTSPDEENDTDMLENLPSRELTPEETVLFRSRISDIFAFVASTDIKVEKKLVWCMISALILSGDASDRIDANHYVLENCASMTLAEFAAATLEKIAETDWLSFGIAERMKLTENLRADSEKMNASLEELISDADDEKTFLKRLSDWVYKLNEKITKEQGLSDIGI